MINNLEPLIFDEHRKIRFGNVDLIRIRIQIGISSLFHAIIKAYNNDYYITDPFNLITKLRKNLSENLDNLTNYNDNMSLTFYGILKNENINKITLETMKNTLINGIPKDFLYIKYISDQLNINIYMINGNTMEIILNTKNNKYIDRESIILIIIDEHYELLGQMEDNFIVTKFNNKSSLINYLNMKK